MPLIPVARPALGEKELDAIGEVFASRWLGLGRVTEEFEGALSELLGSRPVLATNTGTSAIELALRTIGVGPGDDVITPAMTFVATAQAIAATGARPVLCDIDPVTLNATAETMEKARTPQTRAVVPVDYRGLPVDVDEICAWAASHGIRVVQDSAHAFGSYLEDGALVGSRGDVTCFSFDPIKNITCGEGGAIVFEDQEEHERASRLRVLGIDSTAWSRLEAKRPWEYDVLEVGYRFHMPNFAAAVGMVQLGRIEAFRSVKQRVLRAYQDAVTDVDGVEMPEFPTERCVPFLAVVVTDRRDDLMQHLRDSGVGSGVQYQPLSAFTLFAHADAVDLSATEEFAKSLVTLPVLNDQSLEEQETVVEAIRSFA